MPNRREFLQTGAVVSAVALHGVIAGSANAVGRRSSVAPRRALYDDRYPEGHRFAAAAATQGVAPQALDGGEVTRLYAELDSVWRRERVAVAGLTQFGPMFVLERLAAEHRMSVALRVEHRVADDGTLTHLASGPGETLTLAAGGAALRSDWPGLMAALACGAVGDDSPRHTAEWPTPVLAPSLVPPPPGQPRGASSIIHYYAPLAFQQGHEPPLDGPLYSWLVAPRERG